MQLGDTGDVGDILRRATRAVDGFGPYRVDGAYLTTGDGLSPWPGQLPDPELDPRVTALATGGQLALSDKMWHWALPLSATAAPTGYLVVRSPTRPSADDFLVLEAVARQAGAALAHTRRAHELQAVIGERDDVNAKLSTAVTLLRQQTHVHEVLTNVSASGTGEPGIAQALCELTGLPVAIEDRFGNLRAWAGPGQPHPYPMSADSDREDLLHRASVHGQPLRDRARVVSLARPRQEILGLAALIDPGRTAGEHELFALEYATTVLALELAHQRNLAEMELRLHRNLVDDLIAGTDEDSAYARAAAVGHDLRHPHYVMAVDWDGHRSDDGLVDAIRKVMTASRLAVMVSRHASMMVTLIDGRPDPETLYRSLSSELGTTRGVVGIGGRSDNPSELPRSYTEALRALEIRRTSRISYGATAFDTLGVYRVLDFGEVENFVREWLGVLIDYDKDRHASLVGTLSRYLECGGNYDETAAALNVHRSTLRYRLGRIRSLTRFDLRDPDARLNLHVATRAWRILQGDQTR